MNDTYKHWDKIYANSTEEKLGWFETDLTPTLRLIKKANIMPNSRIINIGAGSTTLIDELQQLGYTNLLATDISKVALDQLKSRVTDKVKFIVDDLTEPTLLPNIKPVDIWIDRAVLHFLVNDKEQRTYFSLVNKLVKPKGFVLLAEFSLAGAAVCSGLPVHRYSKEMLADKLGNDFTLVESFDYTYTMPSGDKRPYVYTLFQRS